MASRGQSAIPPADRFGRLSHVTTGSTYAAPSFRHLELRHSGPDLRLQPESVAICRGPVTCHFSNKYRDGYSFKTGSSKLRGKLW